MGLNITTVDTAGYRVADYERLGSYHTLHILRQWVFELVGNAKDEIEAFYGYTNRKTGDVELKVGDYPCLLDHSDCGGGYISFKTFGIVDTRDKTEWGDLDGLRRELRLLGRLKGEMPEEVKRVFLLFRRIVNKKSDGYAPPIVLFR